jgi:energy-coupling factor transport system permease protein
VLFLTLLVIYLNPCQLVKLLFLLSLSAIGVFFTGVLFRENQANATNQGFLYGIHLASRVYCFGTLGGVFIATTSLTELIYSLQQQLRLPPVFAYGLMAAFHMAPLIPKEYRNIQYSLKSRGISYSKLSLKPLIPLMVKSIRWSELLAAAMESRGFAGDEPRTYSVCYTINLRDWFFCLGLLGAGIALSLLSPFLG